MKANYILAAFWVVVLFVLVGMALTGLLRL